MKTVLREEEARQGRRSAMKKLSEDVEHQALAAEESAGEKTLGHRSGKRDRSVV